MTAVCTFRRSDLASLGLSVCRFSSGAPGSNAKRARSSRMPRHARIGLSCPRWCGSSTGVEECLNDGRPSGRKLPVRWPSKAIEAVKGRGFRQRRSGTRESGGDQATGEEEVRLIRVASTVASTCRRSAGAFAGWKAGATGAVVYRGSMGVPDRRGAMDRASRRAAPPRLRTRVHVHGAVQLLRLRIRGVQRRRGVRYDVRARARPSHGTRAEHDPQSVNRNRIRQHSDGGGG